MRGIKNPNSELHVFLGTNNIIKIKMQKCPKVGKISEQVAEQTKMGGSQFLREGRMI